MNLAQIPPRWLIPAVSIAVVAVAAVPFPASGDQPSGTTTSRIAAPRTPSTFTLITGDKVIARQSPGGTFGTEVRPGPGRAGMMFHKVALGNQQLVIPFDAVPLVTDGIVDPRLFDVALAGLDH
ncbi:hypothetical protein AB0F43_21475 [Kribbella sp. NPDC023972]|uniref:hypothetical protein n=1 Tax=Kribbella sp. NPDC023972 TaxID=3154795 RepID=UPI00340B78DB